MAGLLGYMAAGAAERGGAVVEKVGLAQIEADIREAQAKRLAEHTSQLQEGVEVRREDRGIINARNTRGEILEENIANAPRLREVKIADAIELTKATDAYNRDPKNVEAKAVADAAAKKFAATAEADLTATLLKDPAWLKNKKAIMNVEHPERAASAAASMASVAKSKFELETATDLREARRVFAKAQEGADPEAIKVARDRVSALEGTAGRAQQVADGAMNTVYKDMLAGTRDRIKSETAALLRAKEPGIGLSDAEKKAREDTIAAAEKDLAELRKSEQAQLARLDAGVEAYQRQYGARTATPKPKGIINVAPGELSGLDQPAAKPPLSSFGGKK